MRLFARACLFPAPAVPPLPEDFVTALVLAGSVKEEDEGGRRGTDSDSNASCTWQMPYLDLPVPPANAHRRRPPGY